MKIPDSSFRCPQELKVTPTPLRRVMVIGSCLATAWPSIFSKSDPGCPCDFLLFNNVYQLSPDPPQPAGEYDFQVIQVALRSLVPDESYFKTSQSDVATYERLLADAKETLSQTLAAALRWNRDHGLLTFVCNFTVPQMNPMGRLLPRYDLRNFVHFVEKLNEALAEEITRYDNVHFFDVDQVIASYGRKYFQDDVYLNTNHGAALSNANLDRDQERLEPVERLNETFPMRVHDLCTYLWMELMAMYRTLRQVDMVKLVVLDIDDTLWRGVAAEETLFDRSQHEGWPVGLLDALFHLKQRGVLLALCSKNDEGRVKEIWPQLMDGRLGLEDFVSRKINWRPKAENLEDILRETNLLPRNVLFIDDNPVERESVKAAFPEIRVMGANPYVWRRILLWSSETQVANISSESARRTEMVRSQMERETQRAQLSREEFLASLNLEVTIFRIADTGHALFPRTLELINKTNQFNTSGQRRTEQGCKAAVAAGTKFYAFSVKDRFTAYGVVGVLVVEREHIAQYVMSCRVVGLDVEAAALAEIINILQREGVQEVTASLVETELNLLCRDVYRNCGFTRDGRTWRRSVGPAAQIPGHVTLKLDPGAT